MYWHWHPLFTEGKQTWEIQGLVWPSGTFCVASGIVSGLSVHNSSQAWWPAPVVPTTRKLRVSSLGELDLLGNRRPCPKNKLNN